MIFMNNKTELEKVKAEIESKKEEKEKYINLIDITTKI